MKININVARIMDEEPYENDVEVLREDVHDELDFNCTNKVT